MVTRLLIVLALLAGCEKRSELYCDKNPEDLAHCPRSDAPEMAMMCTDNTQCTTQKPFCEPMSHTCVGCLTNTDCQNATAPNCDPQTLSCLGCVAHTDCPSNACLPGGTCGDDSNVIYVDPATGLETNDGTKAKPLASWTKALTFLTTTRMYIKLTGTLDQPIVIMDKDVVVLTDPGTKLIAAADPAIKINGSRTTIYGLEIACGAGNFGGIRSEMTSTTRLYRVYIHNCEKIGLEAKGGYLESNQSTIEGNLEGIVTDAAATYVLTNNFIIRNGNTAAVHGGADLGNNDPSCRFEFNTVAHNVIKSGLIKAAGVTCPVNLGTLTIPNNLIIANTGSLGNNTGNCATTGSAVDPDDVPYAFKSTVAPYDYHLLVGSKAIDMATTSSSITVDIDGEFRPIGMQKDLGADEFRGP